jgi:YHS domain-containing protein
MEERKTVCGGIVSDERNTFQRHPLHTVHCKGASMNSEYITDPVCWMSLPQSEAKAQMTYQGRTYYFCDSACLTLFKLEPEKYIAPLAQKKENNPAIKWS